MAKRLFFVILTILLLIGYIFHIDKDISNRLELVDIKIQSIYYKYITNIKDIFHRYYNQSIQIKSMQKDIDEQKHYKLLYNLLKQKDCNQTYSDINVTSVRVLSYLSLIDFSKVILNINLQDKTKIYPLITKHYHSAGIVLTQDDKTIAYLNTNKRANYAVFIGKEKAPGITSGIDKDGNMLVEYIPKWYHINIGDDIVTSGMDDIFPYGIEVGTVKDIKTNPNTNTIVVNLYEKVLNKKYFYILEK